MSKTKQTVYKALADGYLDDILRKEGDVFASDAVFEIMPTWLERQDPHARVNVKEATPVDRLKILQTAIKNMLSEDVKKTSNKFWIGNGAPEIAELERRTRLKDITASERNTAWQSVQLPPSGKTKNQK